MKMEYKKPQLDVVAAELEDECMGPSWIASKPPQP